MAITKEREVKKTLIITRKCRVREYGESAAKPCVPGLVITVPIEDANYLVGVKCAEIYTGDTPPGQIDKKFGKQEKPQQQEKK